jgi:ribosome-interacting GTPase 1
VDKDKPYILPVGSTVNDLAFQIHRDLPEKMKFARVWGEGRYSGQQVHRTDMLQDKDVVEIHN